ncbi:phytanoyl-CoA dioxygenase family protein [Pseudaestuariivita sp.]|uniref:phytanoyl-CoA dioxygenase family protein n=1 Tax=Pseudaestuariivita sp. TaxID=2211669 RepID=UPI0040582E3B
MLSTAEIETFDRQGYLVVEDVLEPDRLAAVHAEYRTLMAALYAAWVAEGRVPADVTGFWEQLRTSYEAGCDWFQALDISLPGDQITPDTPFHFGPAVFDMVTSPRVLDLVEALIGPEITSNPIQHLRIKPPAPALREAEIRPHVTATDWHQDRAVAHAEADDTRMVTVWLAMTDATTDNGCLQVLPRAGGMLPHCPKKQTAIADGYVDPSEAVPLPVKAGGAVIFHPLTPHASLPNGTRDFRWSFDLRYNVTGAPTGRAHFPDFVARSQTQPVLTDWRAWKSMWEDARTHLSTQPHIEIHRWQSDAPACA